MAWAKRKVGRDRYVVERDGVPVTAPPKPPAKGKSGKEARTAGGRTGNAENQVRLFRADEAEAFIVAERDKRPARDKDKAWQAHVDAVTRRPVEQDLAEIRPILMKRHDADEVEVLLRGIEPVLKAGKQGVRRERRYLLPPAAPTKAA